MPVCYIIIVLSSVCRTPVSICQNAKREKRTGMLRSRDLSGLETTFLVSVSVSVSQ